jgi:hypothetical protein
MGVAQIMAITRTHLTPEEPACHSTRATRDIVAHVSDLMRAEYSEMPGLSLTVLQAMRLWSVDRTLCELGLSALVAEGFLQQSADGMYRIGKPRRRTSPDRRH